MNNTTKARTALITGGSKGIGAAVAERLARDGCNLILVARSAVDLDEVRQRLKRDYPVDVRVEAADVANPATPIELAARCQEIDILVNNAGAVPRGNLFEIDDGRWRAAFDLKVYGYINMCRAFFPVLVARGGGVIINVIGVGGLTRSTDHICLAAANAAVSAFTQALGAESHRERVRVIGVSPGLVATERLRKQFPAAAFADGQPLELGGRRVGEPEEIANVVAFAASDAASYMSGTIVNADLGLSRT